MPFFSSYISSSSDSTISESTEKFAIEGSRETSTHREYSFHTMLKTPLLTRYAGPHSVLNCCWFGEPKTSSVTSLLETPSHLTHLNPPIIDILPKGHLYQQPNICDINVKAHTGEHRRYHLMAVGSTDKFVCRHKAALITKHVRLGTDFPGTHGVVKLILMLL